MHELLDYFGDEVERQRMRPRVGLLAQLADARILSDDEIARNCLLLLVAGHETTANLLGNGTLALLRSDGGPRQRIAAEPTGELLERTVEELLRYDSPIQVTKRIPLDATIDLDGRELERGDMVVLLLGSANRDREVFADPDQLNLDRPGNPHLAFGGGAHYCIGARLARTETRIALHTLSSLLPLLTLDEEPQVKEGVIVRGRESLCVRLE
jgi:cytochrome P450